MNPPKPVARQIAEGDPAKRGKHKLQEMLNAAPKPTRGLPPCPTYLSDEAKAQWKVWASELKIMGVDFLVDGAMLEGAAVAFETVLGAGKIIRELGLVNESDDGKRRAEPAVAIQNAALAQMRAYCREAGLTLSGREGISIETQGDDAVEMEEKLSEPRTPRARIQ